MGDATSVAIQVDIERGDDQQPQHQQQQGRPNSATKFHFVFGSVKLLMIMRFQSLYMICDAIYLISLIQVIGSTSSNWVYWILYIFFGTLGFELLLWTNLSLVMMLATNICLLVYALASSGLLWRGYNWFQELLQPLASSDRLMRSYDWFLRFVHPLASPDLVARGYNWFGQLVQSLENMPLPEVSA